MKYISNVLLLIFLLNNSSQAFVFYEDTKIWNQSSITFHFLDGSRKQQQEVKKFAKLWERYTGIKFKYTNSKPSFFDFKKYYKITFKGSANESTRGAINGIIHFGSLSGDIIFRKTTILHEFGHMLGLGHEHQRTDRPRSLNDNSLLDLCVINQNQSKSWCKENLFNQYTSEVFIKSDYDPQSIMHYKMDNITGQKNGNKPEIWHNKNSLSYTDKYFIAMLYNQNISDSTLENMHKQDLWQQQKFEIQANKDRQKAIMNLSSSSCKPLMQNTQADDGKYCNTGFMVIGKDGYSLPGEEFKTCHNSLKSIKKIITSQQLCQLSYTQLSHKRQLWRDGNAQYGNCKRLDTEQKNNQEYFCNEGFSFVTLDNNMIGDKTICLGSEQSIFESMQQSPVCNLTPAEYSAYQRKVKYKLNKRMKTNSCQVVKKKYKRINCPSDYDYTIIDLQTTDMPINNKCFASKYQAINAMEKMNFCRG